ncbi:MAG: hypothetical protein WCR52_09530, partial [Bacteroidota bacterium]
VVKGNGEGKLDAGKNLGAHKCIQVRYANQTRREHNRLHPNTLINITKNSIQMSLFNLKCVSPEMN